MGDHARRLLVVVILLAGAYLRSPNLLGPWLGVHNAWGGAVYGGIARNFSRYGYGETRLGPVSNSGLAAREEFEYYYHYPPLLVWLVSLSYQAFGVHEWSARLVPLSFSLLLMALVYRFAWRAFSRSVGLVSLLFSAVLPIESYYGAHVDVYGSVAVFFSLLTVYGYFRWLTTRARLHLAMCMAGVVFGCMTAWYTYFVVPLILVHYYRREGEPGSPRSHRLLILPAAAVGVFLLFLLHREVVLADAKGELYGTLLEKLRIRASFPRVVGGRELSPLQLGRHVLRDVVRMFSAPLLALAGLGLALFARDRVRGRLGDGDWCLLILLAFGLFHSLAFPSLVPGHDYLAVCYAPGVSVAAAVTFAWAIERIGREWNQTARTTAVGALLAVIVGVSLAGTRRLRSEDDLKWAQTLVRWGEIIRRLSPPRASVLSPDAPDRVFQYYADRAMVFRADTVEEVRAAEVKDRGDRRPPPLFVCPRRSAGDYAEVLSYLDGKYRAQEEGGLIAYVLDARASAPAAPAAGPGEP